MLALDTILQIQSTMRLPSRNICCYRIQWIGLIPEGHATTYQPYQPAWQNARKLSNKSNPVKEDEEEEEET